MSILFYYSYIKNCFKGYDTSKDCHDFVDSDGRVFTTSNNEIFCVKPE